MDNEFKIIRSSIMFIDTPGFVRLVNSDNLVSTFNYLDKYYNFVGDVVYSNYGNIIKYIGDGIILFFEDSNNANSSDNAVKSAIKIIENKDYIINCSIHTGEVLIGKLGHPKLENIDIIGDAVNIVFQQIKINKQYNIKFPFIFITEETKNKLKHKYIIKEIGEFSVKGMNLCIKTYQVFG